MDSFYHLYIKYYIWECIFLLDLFNLKLKMMLSKVTFPNPFGFPKSTKEEIQSLQEKYKFSDEYAIFLLDQNGFNDLVFFDTDYKNYTTNYTDEEPWQMFGCLYGLNSNSEYYDLIEAQTYNIFTDIFFKIGTNILVPRKNFKKM